ncbi:MAG: hypothetical protein Q8R02_22220 [Hyphomonadaceae bacterium]|nr:hypothetical protein [Hyphomonadaceae bacterium]
MRIFGSILILQLIFCSVAVAQEPYKTQRKAYGAPDLEGIWTNITATPLQRPPAFDSLTTTEVQAAEFERASVDSFLNDNKDGVGGRQSEWWEVGQQMTRINGEIRTSVIVDPANGRMPYTAAGQAMLEARMKAEDGNFDGPEVRPPDERCLVGGSGTTGAPIFTARYNGQYQIIQSPDVVVIAIENGGQIRMIRLREDRHPPPDVRLWMGHSIGRWEGDTLVVETTNFMPGDGLKHPQPIFITDRAKITERFTRISPTAISYQYSVEDPDLFSQTWRGEQLFSATANRMFEYACHEGNYAMPNILRGARHRESTARAK